MTTKSQRPFRLRLNSLKKTRGAANCSTWNAPPFLLKICDNMRNITEIIIHCSDTPEGRDDRAKNVRAWHKARGFRDIGYHFVVDLDGTIENGRPVEKIGAHCSGKNATSIGVCYIGGRTSDMKETKDTRTPAQKAALLRLLKELRTKYPAAKIYGHRDFANKACPCFDAKKEYANI